MAKNSSVDQAALAFKVLDGKASPEEQHAFDLWLSQNPENWEEFADLKILWENSNYKSSEADPDAFEQIKRIVEKEQKKRSAIRGGIYLLVLIVVSALIYLITSHSMTTHDVNLRFDNVTVSSIIKDVESAYHVKIECDDAIKNCRFSGIFYRHDEPETIIRAIAKSLNIQVLNPAVNTFKLMGKGC